MMRGSVSGLREWRTMVSRAIAPGDREALALEFVRGRGIEIGALHHPLPVSAATDVIYVDRLPVDELRRQYPELEGRAFTDVDVVSDGETLPEFGTGTLDFVIANHFLEHCENPIGALETFNRVLKPGGIVYLAIPDKRFTFDAGRATTSLEHLIRDYREGPEWSRDEHFREWRVLVEREFRDDPQRCMDTLTARSYSIHFHVWTAAEILELFVYLQRPMEMPFELDRFVRRNNEVIAILRKT